MGSFWAKYVLFGLKKYSGIIFHQTEERCKIWRGIEMSFQNWHKEFDDIWPEHLKVSDIFILMGSFWAKYYCFTVSYDYGIIQYCINVLRSTCESYFLKFHYLKEFLIFGGLFAYTNSFILNPETLAGRTKNLEMFLFPFCWRFFLLQALN